MSELSPVLTIDGPSGAGKGTVSRILARRLGWHYLDSGALYRITGYAATQAGLALDSAHEHTIARMAEGLDIVFTDGRVLVEAEVRTSVPGLKTVD